MLKRIWNLGRVDVGGNKQLESKIIVHAVRIHANAHWKQLRATTAHITDPRNRLETKPSCTGASHTAWDNISVIWTGEECWEKHIAADGPDEWNSFLKTAP